MFAALLCGCLGTKAADNSPAVSKAGSTSTQNVDAVKLTPWQKPAWLTDFSLGVKEGYDDNVYLAGADQKYLPPAYTVPPGSAVALQGHASWFTMVSPKLGVKWSPLQSALRSKVFSMAYAPDFVTYHAASSEDCQIHRLVTAIKGDGKESTFNLDNSLIYVDGSRLAPTYPGGLFSSFATAALRERREQIQDRAALIWQYGQDKWFVRPTASLLYYELMTEQLNVTGYQNYADRYDVNGGVDFGYKVVPPLAITLGYRYGHQYQQKFSFSPYASCSDYQRVLLGLEGKPWKWLQLKIQGGPDFRNYQQDTATQITPVSDKDLITYFGEAALTATLSTKDTVTFKYKQFQWVSSIGKVPYFDSAYELAYHRKLTEPLALDLGGRLLSADYNSGNLQTCRRYDLQYTISAGLGYAITTHVSASLSYACDLGRNAEDGVANPQTREFNHQVVTLGAMVKF